MCTELANGENIEPKEKKLSLLKLYTNFDSIRNMNIDELAEKLSIIELNAICVYISADEIGYNRVKNERKKQWLEWLESEAEE